MVATIILTLGVLLTVFVILVLFALAYYDRWHQRAHEMEREQLSRDEKLVEAAERDYRRRDE